MPQFPPDFFYFSFCSLPLLFYIIESRYLAVGKRCYCILLMLITWPCIGTIEFILNYEFCIITKFSVLLVICLIITDCTEFDISCLVAAILFNYNSLKNRTVSFIFDWLIFVIETELEFHLYFSLLLMLY